LGDTEEEGTTTTTTTTTTANSTITHVTVHYHAVNDVWRNAIIHGFTFITLSLEDLEML
jgi:hypothetical protein